MYDNSPLRVNKVWLILIVFSIVSGIYILLDFNKPIHYQLLPTLPFSFVIVNLLFKNIFVNIFKNIGVSLIIGLYFIRFSLVPFLMTYGHYSSLIKLNIELNMHYAIYLMIYELFFVYIALYFIIKKVNKNQLKNTKKILVFEFNKIKILGIIISILAFFNILVLVLFPESRDLYTNIFNVLNKDDSQIVSVSSLVDRGSIRRAILTLFTISMELSRILLPIYALLYIRKKIGERILGVILSIPLILTQFFIVSNTHARSIMCIFLLILVLIKLYPSFERKLYTFSIFTVVAFIFFYFSYKMLISTESPYYNLKTSISDLMNAYFSGPDNISGTFNLNLDSKWETFSYTIISSIPFNGTIFGTTGQNISTIYNLSNNTVFQIAPLISESYYFFGFIFSPILSILVTFLAVYFGAKAYKEKNIWKYVTYQYLTLLLSMSLVMYNATIFLGTFFALIVPLWIISTFFVSSASGYLPSEKETKGRPL